MVREAKAEAQRMLGALKPYVERGIAVVGLEPSCLLTLRDEFKAMLPGPGTDALAGQALLFEEFLAREHEAGRLALALKPLPEKRALVHGHCHQKAFGAMPAVRRTLALVPGLEIEMVESSCCGMAGNFGYEAAHHGISMKMAEAVLLPKVRAAGADTIIVADGTSCRQQIADGAARKAVHVARVLARALA
jgi:Fe-S oxidoreductase